MITKTLRQNFAKKEKKDGGNGESFSCYQLLYVCKVFPTAKPLFSVAT
jgi:hypothetical protein